MSDSKTILLIDDEELILRLLSQVFVRKGFNVLSASSADAGFEILEDKAVDLILLDISMPGTPGDEACRRIKGNERTSHIPVIFLSNENFSTLAHLKSSCHAEGFISKLKDMDTIVSYVQRFLT